MLAMSTFTVSTSPMQRIPGPGRSGRPKGRPPPADAEPSVHIHDLSHGTGNVLVAPKRVRGRVSACN